MFKKSTALLLVIFTVLISISSALHVFAAERGDVNDDGKVGATDYLLVKRYVLGSQSLTSAMQSRADVDNDGDIDKTDYIIIKRIALGTLNSSTAITRKTVVSYSKTYTTDYAPSSTYEDTYGAELTDGVISPSASYTSTDFCGFEYSVNIIVDLGTEDGNNLCAFEVSYLNVNEAGIKPASSFTVYGSNDNSSWTYIDRLSIPSTITNSVESATIELDNTVNYRYIRFYVAKTAHWLFLDEVLVYAEITETDSDSSADPYESDPKTDALRTQSLAAVSSGASYDSSVGNSLISKGRSYSFSCAGYDSRCGSNYTLLTDGAAEGATFADANWVGIDASGESYIRLNLGSVQSDISAFAVHCFRRETAKVYLPEYIDVSVSTDNSVYYDVGRIYAPDTSKENYSFVLSLGALISARYVKFSFPAGEGYIWIEEVEVYANRSSSDSSVYGYFEMPLSEIPSYWQSSSPDYNTEQNLLLGKLPEITSDSEIAYTDLNVKHNSPETSALLTDGLTTNGIDTTVDPWFGFYYGAARNVFFDLGNISSVSDFSVRLLYRTSWAIYCPDNIDVYLSENGKDWYVGASVVPEVKTDDSVILVSGSFDDSYRARYVMFRFNISIHVFMDEITVTGMKNIKNAAKLENSELTKTKLDFGYTYAAPSEDLIGGAEDVCLIYHNTGIADTDMFRPYVAYVDENGNTVDTMFDSFLFLPGTGSLPSGGTPWGTNTASDWQFLFDDMFDSGRNFDALETVLDEVKKELCMPDYTVKIFVAIPHIDTTLTDFGDIDGDGDSENLTVINNRVYVSRYYAEKVMSEFDKMNYNNIELCGFYWFHEEISGNDVATAKAVNASFDDLGMPLFWIPWYCAPGYSTWKTNGFDLCCMQPNYAFSENATETRIENTAEYALQYGMCIEIEIHWSAATDYRYFKNYMEYLSGGVKYGYMDHAIHMYYQSFDSIGSQCYAENDRLRLIYDYTYQFIKGALDIKPDGVSELSFTAKSNTPYADTLNPESTEAVIYRVSKSPEHGSLAFDESGRFVYYPNKEFKGTDTFTYQISNHLGWSEDCTVTVTVE